MLGAPGEHTAENAQRGPNAIKLSERAAAILQGFPETWVFAGATKRARWSQIGQAMPPPLAEAVARRLVVQMAAARATEAPAPVWICPHGCYGRHQEGQSA
jgi:site-specific DNA-cytosine methylase